MDDELDQVRQYDLGPISVNNFGEKYFFNLNRNSFDRVSAGVLFDAKFGKDLFAEDTLNVVIGTDSGLLPKYLQSKFLPKGTRYLFIEPEGVLQALKQNQLLDGLDEKILCVGLEQWPEAIKNFKINDYLYINAVRSYNAICAQDDYIEEYAELSWHITEVLSQLHWQISVELGSEAFIARQIINLADNQRPAKVLEKAFVDKTVLILAGGPSLDEVLPWLRSHRNDVVVFAVSRISRQLLQANIEPDFVFSVDPTDLSFDISKEMLEFSSKPIFVYSYHTVPTLVNQWHGLGFYLGPRLPWPSPLNVANIGSAGPTVTNTALSVAYHFGFKRMVLAGVDLCFTREGFTHATGSDEQLAGPRFNLTSLQVETNAGFMAPTSCDFSQAILSLGFQAKQLSGMGCRIFNISGGSAKVENIEYLPISEIEFGGGSINVAEIVAERVSESAEHSKYHKQILDELGRAQFQIKGIARLAENARRINDEMYSADGVIGNYKDKKRLDQIEKKFKREHRHYSKLVKSFGIRSFIKLTKAFNDEAWSAEEAKQLGNVFYDAYREGAAKLMCLLDDALERVQARQQEYADIPNFGLVIEQYRKDRSFGRVRLWKAAAEVPVDVRAQFADFEKRFLDIVHDKHTRHFAKAKSQGNLSSLKQRAGLLFKHKKIEELSDLLISLSKHQDQQAVEPYRHLITGYLAELQHASAQALDAYRQIVDGGGVLVEQALIRIADIGIDSDDAHTANLALQCLSQLNPVYLPLYAEMQRLHGDVMVAIDAYNNYIGQFPSDTLAQIKLANLYTEQGIYDAAIMMLDYILAQKPDLEVALTMKAALVSAGF
ncbi:DUF115 domain-containing protein [Methylomonas sp. EFPC1]|uniref:motility associated factor glycosyltransferase family protein n=1 Tax=Methylomonas sp. EFPC1 TaxID=2812647 RepID=UPI00196806D9|nr:6-hydroxymethylpterin diphosphokinase MptE-like protein [Methylomonas sp. EFPC1]QSB02177.1 DUF115 domain-containing protein [Methylomonas sp. EFPC1]